MMKIDPKWGETAESLLKKALEAEDKHLRTRLMALSFVASGKPGSLVAKTLGKSRESIGIWIHKFNERGLPGLVSGWKGNPRRSLEQKEINLLREAVCQHPRKVGFEAERWTAPLVADFIGKHLGKTVCSETARKYLHLMGFEHTGRAKAAATDVPDIGIAAAEFPKKLEQGQTHDAGAVYVCHGHVLRETLPETGWFRSDDRTTVSEK